MTVFEIGGKALQRRLLLAFIMAEDVGTGGWGELRVMGSQSSEEI